MKRLVAVLLLPVCLGASRALFWMLREVDRLQVELEAVRRSGDILPGQVGPDVVWVPLVGGAACWLVIYVLLPRPMWVYVFGHELTHALWAWLFRGKVKRFKVTSQGGHVVLTKVNFLITLAPYFFPLYAVLVGLLYGLGCLVGEWERYHVWFLLALGAAHAFHLTLTWHALQTEQTDITSQGYLFSAVVIWLGNVGILLVALPPLLGVPYAGVAEQLWLGTRDVIAVLLQAVHWRH